MKKERDYSTGKIYKIWSFNTDEIYIGSTIQALSERLRGHKKSFNHYKKTGKDYRASFIILENEHYDIELIEYCPCKTKLELCRREGELQREIKCVNQNINIAGRTKKEHYEDNKEYFKERKKEWLKKNEGYQQKYYEKNKEHIAKRKKKYRGANKENIKEYEKEIRKIRVICECGKDIMKRKKAQHIKSEKHIRLMEEKKTI